MVGIIKGIHFKDIQCTTKQGTRMYQGTCTVDLSKILILINLVFPRIKNHFTG